MAVTVSLEDRVKSIFNKVLDIKPQEIKFDLKLDQSLGIDSTEMVEICVGLKKEFSVVLLDNEIQKTHTLNDIVRILKTKGVNS